MKTREMASGKNEHSRQVSDEAVENFKVGLDYKVT